MHDADNETSFISFPLMIRVEKEHLNNVGKFRAFKSVPLPFSYDEDEQKEGQLCLHGRELYNYMEPYNLRGIGMAETMMF